MRNIYLRLTAGLLLLAVGQETTGNTKPQESSPPKTTYNSPKETFTAGSPVKRTNVPAGTFAGTKRELEVRDLVENNLKSNPTNDRQIKKPKLNTTLPSELVSSGSGQKELIWDPVNDWQRITYNCDVNLSFKVTLNAQRGDISQYTIVELKGTVHFWGTAEDQYYESHNTWNFDDTHNYTIENPSGGLLEYSASKQRVTYVQSSLSSGGGDVVPYYIQFFGLAHPYSARVWIDLPSNWYFDNDYDNCNPGMGVDLTYSAILSPRADISYDPAKFQYNSAYPGNWRMVALGAYVQADFELENAPGSAKLVIDHLSSGDPDCPGGGYSPVDIIVNGMVVEAFYDPAEHHPGSHGFVTDQWNIGGYLHSGANNIRVQICNNACSHYWIRYLYIDDLGDDCANCKFNVPRLFALVIGVDDPEEHKKKGSLDAQYVFDTLRNVPASANLTWANSDDGNPQEPTMLSRESPVDIESLIEDKLDAMQIEVNDTFVFYISAHGGHPYEEKDETPVLTQKARKNPTNPNEYIYYVEPDTNDEAIVTGKDVISGGYEWITDDNLPALFDDSKWENVKKIFMLQTCYGGGFVGSSENDEGDLEKLHNCLLLDSANEGKFSIYAAGGNPIPEGAGFWTFELCPVLWQNDWEHLRMYMARVKKLLEEANKNKSSPKEDIFDPNVVVPFEFSPSFAATADFDTTKGLGGAGSGVPLCDFNQDGKIDFQDLAGLAGYWLQEELSFDVAPRPFGDGIVDIYDLGCIAENWLYGVGL